MVKTQTQTRTQMQTRERMAVSAKHMVLAAFFLALGIIMPFLTGQIPGIGNMLLPMHIPVLVCGYVCGWQWGLAVGFVVPLLRSAMFGMPPMMPTAAAMAFELAVYGAVTGILNSQHSPLWSGREGVFLADIYGRSIAECGSGDNTAACADSGYYHVPETG